MLCPRAGGHSQSQHPFSTSSPPRRHPHPPPRLKHLCQAPLRRLVARACLFRLSLPRLPRLLMRHQSYARYLRHPGRSAPTSSPRILLRPPGHPCPSPRALRRILLAQLSCPGWFVDAQYLVVLRTVRLFRCAAWIPLRAK